MNIAPIKLLKGTHENTATTGSGCFMNVIAYLNGESQITDSSPCVCVTVRRMAIELNDRANDEQRQRLLPFVLRAMGSATKDVAVLRSRITRLRQYGKECEDFLRADADAYANANANAYANAYAYAYAYANASIKAVLFDAGLRYLDDVLPKETEASNEVACRVETLVGLQAEHV